ncbi:hypothetical protein ACSBL2_07890 [Pedobacter sp. AW31-3R]|uniref:hypothetical protein n=1 Tax=Pedobacter sp. AW31-3R TaxID=3445781 RepID=UPI003F9FF1D2
MEMIDHTTLHPTLWSEVINYLRFSATDAENLKLKQSVKELSMDHISVFRTTVQHQKDLEKVAVSLNKLIGKEKWTIDLDDEEKVLRAIFRVDRQEEIIDACKRSGFSCELMPY